MKFVRRHPYGFTLLEILLSITIGSTVILALSALLFHSSQTYFITQQNLELLKKKRAFHSFLERDFSSVIPSTPFFYQKSGDGASSDQIGFYQALSSKSSDPNTLGDFELVSYRVSYTNNEQGTHPILFRSTIHPVDSLKFLLEKRSDIENIVGYTEPVFPYVISFQARPMIYSNSSLRKIDWSSEKSLIPDCVDFQIYFIDPSAAHLYRTEQDWERLAHHPKDSERKWIHTFRHTYWLK